MLVVLESIIYSGIIEEVVKFILEESGLKCGEDFFLVFLFERVDSGNKVYNIKNILKVVGGVIKICIEIAVRFYENVLEGEVFKVSFLWVVEMEKILENIFRNINIVFVNEMVILCERMNIDIWEVIEAVKIKLYGFMVFYFGSGFGGYCILIDLFYFIWKVCEYDYYIRLIEIVGEINNYMLEYVVERVMKIFNKFKKFLNGLKILILGVVYKKDIDDIRELFVLKIIEIFEKENVEVEYNDLYVLSFIYNGK